ncbi:MAG: hypothetical protein ABIN57_02615 [Chitinophagaceae bacterium]
MYSILKSLGAKKFILRELPSLTLSIFITEMLYKFGSFILECGAFLITWFVASWLIALFQSYSHKSKG